MGKYLTRCVVIAGKKKYLPNVEVELDDDVALPHVVSGAILIVADNPATDPRLTDATSGDPQEAVAAAITAYKAAQEKVDAAQVALDKAAKNQKGNRTSALNKAKAEFDAAREALVAAGVDAKDVE